MPRQTPKVKKITCEDCGVEGTNNEIFQGSARFDNKRLCGDCRAARIIVSLGLPDPSG
jgi:hypothetical protein